MNKAVYSIHRASLQGLPVRFHCRDQAPDMRGESIQIPQRYGREMLSAKYPGDGGVAIDLGLAARLVA